MGSRAGEQELRQILSITDDCRRRIFPSYYGGPAIALTEFYTRAPIRPQCRTTSTLRWQNVAV
ncbi:unnamed protein product, partial [Trichogramma brassicae]